MISNNYQIATNHHYQDNTLEVDKVWLIILHPQGPAVVSDELVAWPLIRQNLTLQILGQANLGLQGNLLQKWAGKRCWT